MQNSESGVVRVVRNGLTINAAKIDETITVYAKIGNPRAAIQWYVADAMATVTSHGSGMKTISVNDGGFQTFLMDTFNIVIPRNAKVGAGSVYFSIDGEVKPALAFTVVKPDILVPNKVLVEPYFITYSDSVLRTDGSGLYDYIFPSTLKDGVQLEAVVKRALKLTYDRDRQAFFFLDNLTASSGVNSLVIRMLKDGVVTTIAGGGTDFRASQGNQLMIRGDFYSGGSGPDMVMGPDHKLYFVNLYTKTRVAPTNGEAWSLIQRIDPETGVVERVIGGTRLAIPHSNRTTDDYRGIVDGYKDTAMICMPQSLTFDPSGNLYFLDGKTMGNGQVMRKLDKEGILTTIVGKVKLAYTLRADPADGVVKHYVSFTEYSQLVEGYGDEVRLTGVKNMARAGNGKFYISSTNTVIEVNPDRREAAIVLKASGTNAGPLTGTFKEVDLRLVSTLDVDFDGNLLFGNTEIYKMDLQEETVSLIAGGRNAIDARTAMRQVQQGATAILGNLDRITFDQFGNLYAGFSYTIPNVDVVISKINIER